MRMLDHTEVDAVAGAEWEFELDFGVVRFLASGSETVQEIAAAASSYAAGAYWAARDAMADFYESVANSVPYDLGCSGGGGGR